MESKMKSNEIVAPGKPKNTIDLINEEVSAWLEKSTFHALPKIIRSKNIVLKLFWTSLFIACTSYCIHALIEHFQNYFKYEVLTYVDKGYEFPAVFPAITICGIFSSNLSTVIKSCNIIFGERYQPESCDINSFSPIKVPGYDSFCYVFRNGTTLRDNQTKPEIQNDIGKKTKLEFQFFTLNNSKGYDAFIHNHSLCALNEQNIVMAPRIYNEVGLKRTRMIKKKKPYSNCVSIQENKFPGETFAYFKEMTNETLYSQRLCYTFCIKYYLNKNCSKYYSNSSKLYDGKKCGILPEIFKVCSENCLVECDSMILSFSILTKNQQSEENFTTLVAYYDETDYIRINEVAAITIEKFLGNIG